MDRLKVQAEAPESVLKHRKKHVLFTTQEHLSVIIRCEDNFRPVTINSWHPIRLIVSGGDDNEDNVTQLKSCNQCSTRSINLKKNLMQRCNRAKRLPTPVNPGWATNVMSLLSFPQLLVNDKGWKL